MGSSRLSELVAEIHLAPSWPPGLGRLVAAHGLPLAAAVLAVVLAGVAWRRGDRGAAALCLVGPALAVLLTDLVAKPLFDRRTGLGLAYPSGHATGAAAGAVLALILCHRWAGWRATVWLAPLALVLPVVMGVVLVRLGWHYPTDVLGGVAMGTATLLGLAAALGLTDRRESLPA